MYLQADSNPDYVISRFAVVGITYRHASVTERSLFAIDDNSYRNILKEAAQQGFKSLFVLSTCNRTELYAYCHDDNALTNLLLKHTNGSSFLFERIGFVKRGMTALNHLFFVSAGLDSQIIGDYEILGQLKAAVGIARRYGLIGPVMDRTVNTAIQSSRAIKTATKLSTGTVSVSYASIEWLRKVPQIENRSILLYGIGKFGTAVAKNLQVYLPSSYITIINRSDDKAASLAASLAVDWKHHSDLAKEISRCDIIIVCTNASYPTITTKLVDDRQEKWILDLSVPENVHPLVKDMQNIHFAGVDDVSALLDHTINGRKEEIPKAVSIIGEYRSQLMEWLNLRRHVPLINDIRSKLQVIGSKHFCSTLNPSVLNSRVNKAIGELAMSLRDKKEKGCNYIKTINEFLQHRN